MNAWYFHWGRCLRVFSLGDLEWWCAVSSSGGRRNVGHTDTCWWHFLQGKFQQRKIQNTKYKLQNTNTKYKLEKTNWKNTNYKMLGMPTLAVGISCQRNRGPVPAKKKYSNRVSPRKDNFFFTFLHGAGKPAWPRTVGRIFETSVQMVLGEIVAQCTCAQTNNCRKDFQMVLGEIVAKTRLYQIISIRVETAHLQKPI